MAEPPRLRQARHTVRTSWSDHGSWPGKTRLARRAEGCELVRHLEPLGGEAEERGRAAARAARGAPLADPLQDAAPEQHTLQVRRRDVVAQRRDIDLAQLGDRERLGASAKPTLVYESFARRRACAAVTSSRSSRFAGAAPAESRSSSAWRIPRYAVASEPFRRIRVSSCSTWARASTSTARASASSSDSPAFLVTVLTNASIPPGRARRTTAIRSW